MIYGTKNELIEKLSDFGLGLTNGNSAVGRYTIFLITISWTDNLYGIRYHTYPFVKGFTLRDLCIIENYWYEITTSLSGNTISVTVFRTIKLSANSGTYTTISATIRNIQGLG